MLEVRQQSVLSSYQQLNFASVLAARFPSPRCLPQSRTIHRISIKHTWKACLPPEKLGRRMEAAGGRRQSRDSINRFATTPRYSLTFRRNYRCLNEQITNPDRRFGSEAFICPTQEPAECGPAAMPIIGRCCRPPAAYRKDVSRARCLFVFVPPQPLYAAPLHSAITS